MRSPSTVQIIISSFGRYRWHVVALVAFGVLSALMEGIGINSVIPLMAFFNGGAGSTDDVITTTIQGIFNFLGIPFSFRFLLGFILVLFILRAVFVIMFGYIRGWISADYLGKESEDVLRRALLASWAFSLQQKIGTMHNTLIRDVQQSGALLGAVAQTIQSFSGFLMYLLVAINISPSMTFYTISVGAVLMFVLRPFLRRSQHIGQKVASIEKQFAQFLSEHIIGMKSIKASGVERCAIADGSAHIRLLRQLSIRQSLVRSIGASFFQPVSILLVVLLFLLTYRTPSFSIISFAASLYLIQKMFTYLESGQTALHSMNEMVPYAQNISAFKLNFDKHRESSEGSTSFNFVKELKFIDVTFSYPDGKRVLKHVNFSIHVGEMVGLIGPSGAGKTSIADILLRLFNPTSGQILIDGIESTSISIEEWRRNIGYVSQDAFLLNDTIEANIRFYNSELKMEDIELATKQANIYDFIISLPEGFQTITGDRGVMLSGGQRQRIALARALAGRPKILVLDEATSALDSASEKLIQDAIHALRGSITVFIIAHRLSTIERADRLIIIEDGKISEQGSPQELLKRPNSYFSKHHVNHQS